MDNFAITAADAVSRRYKSNDPEAIIAQRAIKIKDILFCEKLLGFYTVLLNCEYIGINPNCSKQQRRSALAHELGHAIFDRKHATSGQAFPSTEKEKISVEAERQRRYRAMKRWRADQTEDNFWGVVLAYAGVKFKTYSGLPFSYEIKKGRNGEYTKELWIDRREKSKSLAWSFSHPLCYIRFIHTSCDEELPDFDRI